jgi:ferredoxin
MTTKIQITVDGTPCDADEGTMLLDVLQTNGVHIPTICHHPSLEPSAACRLCVVEISHEDWNGWSDLVTSCNYPIEPGLQVSTASKKVKETRRTMLELYLARCPDAEELRELAREEGLDESSFPEKEGADKCIQCGLCTRVCQDLGPAAIAPLGRGTDKTVGPRPDRVGEDCTGCGACAFICPTGEIEMEQKDGKAVIWNRSFELTPCSVRPELCRGCGMCMEACPLSIPEMIDAKKKNASVARIDASQCTGCGICAGICSTGAIDQKDHSNLRLSGIELDVKDLKGRTIVFACSRSPLPEDTEGLITVPCIGRVSMDNLVECVARGADGVLVMCRDQATCPTGRGGALAEKRAEAADDLLASAGFDRGRVKYVKPEPGLDGPEKALAEFKEKLPFSPLEVTYKRPIMHETGIHHALEIMHWLKHRPELTPVQPLNKRTITQAISLVLLHSSLWDWAQLKWFCNPVLNCHSCALAWFACPVGVFVHYSGYHIFPFLAIGTVLLLGVFIGRLLCGWVCPFGFLQDLIYRIPSRKFVLPAWTSNVKYGVLILMVFMIPFFLGEQTFFSFCRICPAAALQSTIPNLVETGASWLQVVVMVKLGFLVFFLIISTLSHRAFCKVFCPIGAMLAPLNLICFWKIERPTKECVNCTWCDETCPPSGAPSSRISKGVSPSRVLDCIFCYECKNQCIMAGKNKTTCK